MGSVVAYCLMVGALGGANAEAADAATATAPLARYCAVVYPGLALWLALVGLGRHSDSHSYCFLVAQFTVFIVLLEATPQTATAADVQASSYARIEQNLIGMAIFTRSDRRHTSSRAPCVCCFARSVQDSQSSLTVISPFRSLDLLLFPRRALKALQARLTACSYPWQHQWF